MELVRNILREEEPISIFETNRISQKKYKETILKKRVSFKIK